MPCFHPLDARRSPGGTIGFKPMTPFDKLIKLPCGRCTGCRLERSRQTAVRLMHEAQLHKATCFATLTYNDQSLPTRNGATSSQSLTVAPSSPRLRTVPLDTPHTRETHTYEIHDSTASLEPRHLQLFTKRLNESTRRRLGNGVKYYACGEYGEQTHRPHYHIAIYGEDFKSDRVFWKNTQGGHPLYRSNYLKELWPHGDADIGELTFESAAYIARYIMKKINGAQAHEHYRRTDADGRDYWIQPEFARMSRRPGIGYKWIQEFKTSVYPHDRVIVRGHPAKPPRYYDQQLEKIDEPMLVTIKAAREAAMNPENSTPERLRAGEAILAAQLSQLKRPLEK